ncbi:Uncharacterised protein [Enterobacter cloacae]|nr:Uncharacterised protein [Enterobacter cloacae]
MLPLVLEGGFLDKEEAGEPAPLPEASKNAQTLGVPSQGSAIEE